MPIDSTQRLLLTVLAHCLLGLIGGPAAADERTDRFKAEAFAGWKEYRSRLLKLDVRVEADVTSKDRLNRDQLVYDAKYEIMLAGGLLKRTIRTERDGNSDPKTSTAVSGDQYDFSLVKPGDAKVWAIRDVDVDRGLDEVSAGLDGGSGQKAIVQSDLCRGLVLRRIWVDRLFQEPLFRIDDVRETENEGGERIVEFAYTYAGYDDRSIVGSGTLRLLRDRYWLIEAADTEMHWSDADGTMTVTNEYDDLQGLPVVKLHKSTETSGDARDVLTEYVYRWESLEGAVDDAEFTLTHFGLPEPRIPRRGQVWLWVGLLVVLGLLAFGGAALARKMRKG